MFSFDVFEPGRSGGEIALGLLMHNIPSIILIILLAIAWRKEIVGVASYFGAGLLYVGFVIYQVTNSGLPWYTAITWSITIAVPAFVIGILFFINWRKRRENTGKKIL
jgi:peptidoglycan/LPS O-acetylase OafA/YrhL